MCFCLCSPQIGHQTCTTCRLTFSSRRTAQMTYSNTCYVSSCWNWPKMCTRCSRVSSMLAHHAHSIQLVWAAAYPKCIAAALQAQYYLSEGNPCCQSTVNSSSACIPLPSSAMVRPQASFATSVDLQGWSSLHYGRQVRSASSVA